MLAFLSPLMEATLQARERECISTPKKRSRVSIETPDTVPRTWASSHKRLREEVENEKENSANGPLSRALSDPESPSETDTEASHSNFPSPVIFGIPNLPLSLETWGGNSEMERWLAAMQILHQGCWNGLREKAALTLTLRDGSAEAH